MKVVIVLVVLLGVGLLVVWFSGSSGEERLSASEQGREARAAVEICTSWTEVLDRVGDPRKWRDDTSNFDFDYIDRFDETTRDFIAKQLEKNELLNGFSFLYRFSDAVTFAVNFNRKGELSNIQDREGKDALMDAAGG